MSTQTRITEFARTTITDASLTPPSRPPYPETAADRGRDARAEVHFDTDIADMLDYYAERRSCNVAKYGKQDKQNHLIGVAGELACATWRGGTFDDRIFDDYEGDDGVDFKVPQSGNDDPIKVQVKTTRDMKSPDRVVERPVLDAVDEVVLCCTSTPRDRVEIVGHIPARDLRRRKDRYGRDGPAIRPDNILPVPAAGQKFYPDDVRRHHTTK